jgi:hypothetical protein
LAVRRSKNTPNIFGQRRVPDFPPVLLFLVHFQSVQANSADGMVARPETDEITGYG